MESQRTLNSKNIFEKKKKKVAVLFLIQSILKSLNDHNSVVMAERQIDQWNSIENPGIKPLRIG